MSDHLALARTHYENFPVGSLLLPRRQRTHLHRIYAFARTADDLADEHRDAAALRAFREAFAAHLNGTAREPVPLLRDLAATISELRLPPQLFFDLLDAFASDLEIHQHDRASLTAYCRRSADPVGRLVLRVFGHSDPAMDAMSDRICTALQIVNHLQDVGEDARERDRVYLPIEDLTELGIARADLERRAATPALRELIRRWTDTAAGWLREGWPLTARVRGRLAVELRAIVHGVALVVGNLRRIDHDVLATHVRLTRGEKVRAIGRALASRALPKELGRDSSRPAQQ